MASKGTTKYDYGKNGGKDVYGVDAPDATGGYELQERA